MTCRARKGSLFPGKTCQCDECRPLNLRAQKHYTHRGLKVTGRDQARHILDVYTAAGYAPHRIAVMSGLHGHNVLRLVENPQQRMAQATVTALLALPMPPPPHLVGMTRRLQALARIGWGLNELQQRTGIPRTTLANIRSAQPGRVSRPDERTAAITKVYDELSMTPAPDDRFHNKTRMQAVRKKWASPLAWDDDTIDDPAAEPNNGHRTRGIAPKLPDPDILAAEVNRSGRRVVAERYDSTPDAVWMRLNRAGYRASHTGDIHELPIYRKAAA